MKHLLLIATILITISGYAQNDITKKLNEQSKKELKTSDTAKVKSVLPKAEVPTGNSSKDLNATERNKINNIDIKKSDNTVNKNYNTNPDEFSTQPVVKGSSSSKTVTTPVKTEQPKPKMEQPTTIKKKTDKEILEELKIEKNNEKLTKKSETVKETLPEKPKITQPVETEFSTTPIIKKQNKESKENKPTNKEDKSVKKYNNIDTTKSVKDFYFETTPITGKENKPTYNLPNPVKKDKEAEEAKIPVSSKMSSPEFSSTRDKEMKESYDSYSKEADSIRKKNKQWLDSVLNSLPVKAPVMVNQGEYVEIFVSGGGLVAGTNPKIYDRLSIFPTGVVQREYKTKLQGEMRQEKKIAKDELTKLAQYIVDMGFFDFNKDYDCLAKDKDCIHRMETAPEPIPLSISVVVGQRRNKVNVGLYAPGLESNWVNYPKNIEKILNAIYTVIEK